MIVDKTGRNLHEGQLVDIDLMGMYTGVVAKINEQQLLDALGRPAMPPSVIIQLTVFLPIERNMCNTAYIIKQVDSKSMGDNVNGDGDKAKDKDVSNVTKFPGA